MHLLIDKPMIYYPVRALLKVGIKDIIVVLGFGADIVKEYLINEFKDVNFKFVYQRVQRGTGDAVRLALPFIKTTKFLLLYGDMPLVDESVLSELIKFSIGTELVVTTFNHNNPEGYGRIIRDRDDNLLKIIEHKDATETERKIQEVNAGLYLCETNIVKRYIGRIRNNNAQKEYYFPDVVKFALSDKIPVKIFESKMEFLLGSNNRVELSNLVRILQRRINHRLMMDGVGIIDPDSVYIGIDVKIGNDTQIYPNVFISGNTIIGKNVKIENGVIIQNSEVEDSVHIKPYCHIDNAIIKSGAIIGPFARLRPDSVVDEDAHIGNFVELKKTYIGKGSKANHLTYLGDAEIGSGVNVGAGTITCNYDGVNKYKTILEDGVFVGSDTQFVAPVKVGKNAYIGAGSTITEDVPAESLALSRTPQKNIEGWVRKRKRGK
jgi:bifunctional UDP-N-acetylglucosamine pyrophosphorylase/glucosamine-1-phosphate N-acetyltransferase